MTMTYNKKGDVIYLSLCKGENIFDSIYKLIDKEQIVSGWINGIGAIENITIGAYDLNNKTYIKKDLDGVYELTSLMGNITLKDDSPFMHIHVSLSDHNCKALGGHLFDANISIAGEFIINTFSDHIKRTYNEQIGLHLMDFKNCE